MALTISRPFLVVPTTFCSYLVVFLNNTRGCLGRKVAYSSKAFWADGVNIFDFLIVSFGLLELLADLGAPLTVFR